MSHSDPAYGSQTGAGEHFRRVGLTRGIYGALFFVQAIGFLIFGTSRAGVGLSESILVIDGFISLTCVVVAWRRAKGITALFWFLFAANVAILDVPTAIQAHDTVFARNTLSEATRGLIYCLYGAPILMMLFLPETHGHKRVRSEIFLDLFQVAIVVSLIYSTFFFLPDSKMLPADAIMHNVSVSDLQSLVLLIAGFVRFQFSRVPSTRDLLFRLTVFLLSCAVVTFVGDWVDLHYHAYSPYFDLVWSIPVIVSGLIALHWVPSSDSSPATDSASFLSFLGTNLVLVAMLACIALLMDYWKQAHGGILTIVAVALSLFALTLRLALTQYHQHLEIRHRQAAQEQLALSHQKIAHLLVDAQRQTAEISQLNGLGNRLQVCSSRAEVFGLIPDRMESLFPGSSGTLSVFNASRSRAEPVAQWGSLPLERAHSWDHVRLNPASISAPLIANEEALGVLVIEGVTHVTDGAAIAQGVSLERRKQIASALAEQIALTISNLDLREALRSEATRDPLTGLPNRRHMQEFLEREIHRARRRQSPLAAMILDIDHFKRYNDTYGHAAGDQALRFVGEALANSVRAEDLACRYGGEEFVLLLPECSLKQAAVRAEEIRDRFKKLYEEHSGELPQVITASIGVAAFPETSGNAELLIKFADQALYKAKHAGRDRVAIAQPSHSFATAIP